MRNRKRMVQIMAGIMAAIMLLSLILGLLPTHAHAASSSEIRNQINDLKEQVGIKKTIKDYGVNEEEFLARLDEMTEQAFDDQCTGANPRYPLMKEIKQMYLNAYYGR